MQHVQTATVGDRDDVHNRIHNFGLGVLAMLFFGFGSIMTFYFTAAVLIYEVVHVLFIRRFEYRHAFLRTRLFKATSLAAVAVGVLLLILSMSQFFLGNVMY
ncbi:MULTISPECIES: hypothetical protein [unclassified Exiguobacterium]|uniref:hypothetical protein n=1 Tax=unclassified Exiguobacterium TaxID=2644629 RepID=UPI00103CC4A8|nr:MULTISPECIES: hypothetical protein [unclassified Exiguobacterium]TCI68658.1 hypothetical protein EVJ19_10930 [Exiguobacterium sp. IPCI3]TCI78198.1 hypothetical protein EVJ18_10575 [Exiguobacterium sp. IPCH1]TCI79340.1 hypothetical protein EVJ17_10575 [Exiguobacterium sp. IPBC4]